MGGQGYLLALALMLPLNAWLVARLGAKRLYLICFSSFTLASFLCGAATTMPELIGARLIQGMAGGLLAPLAQLMVARLAGRQFARVFGYAAVPVLLAPLAGPILVGTILKYLGWPWLFYINLPVGILAVVLAAWILPQDKAVTHKRPFDLTGFTIISTGLVCLLYGFEQSSHHGDIRVLVLGLVLLVAFLRHAHRRKSKALIDIELFKIRDFSIAVTTQFLAVGIMYGGQFLIPLFLVTGCRLTATQTGWILGSMGVGMLCVYPCMGYLTDKFGCRAVASGGVFLNVMGTLPFLWRAFGGFSMAPALIGLFVRGMGQGATGIPSIAAAYAAVPREKLSLATMAVNIVQRLGAPTITTVIAITVSLSANVTSAWRARSSFRSRRSSCCNCLCSQPPAAFRSASTRRLIQAKHPPPRPDNWPCARNPSDARCHLALLNTCVVILIATSAAAVPETKPEFRTVEGPGGIVTRRE
jgi:EmrB/QacA subfamily drug resistance transporter